MKYRISLFALFLCAGVAAAAPDPAQVARVKEGLCREARASWWGFDAEDSTRFLQMAIHSRVPRLIVDKMPSAWITDRLSGVSDQEIVFEKGVEVRAKPGAFRGTGDTLLTLRCVTNVTLTGYGAALRMRRADYDAPPYKKAEWRHTLSILSSRNVRVLGLTLAESGGDGIYLGCVKSFLPNTDILIRDVLCDKNYRQGISVISADGLRIERTTLRGTAGTPPAAGIDFEPNHPGERITRCVMNDCVAEDNEGCGFDFYLGNLDSTSAPVDILLENCRSSGNHVAVAAATENLKKNRTVKGTLRFSRCRFLQPRLAGLTLRYLPSDGVKTLFDACELVDAAAGHPETADVAIQSGRYMDAPCGGIAFRDFVVRQPVARPWIHWRAGKRSTGLKDVTGKVTLVTPDGKKTTVVLSDAWLETTFPQKVFPRVPRVPADDSALQVVDTLPGKTLSFRPMWMRGRGIYLFFAKRANPVCFRIGQKQVGRYAEKSRPVRISNAGGRPVATFSLPGWNTPAERSLSVPQDGFYRMEVDAGKNAFALLAANVPVAAEIREKEQAFIAASGTLYFPVTEKTGTFALAVGGDGEREKVAVEIRAPNGETVWQQKALGEWDQFTETSAAPSRRGVWSCVTGKPDQGVFEDFALDLLGVPGFFFLSPERYWTTR